MPSNTAGLFKTPPNHSSVKIAVISDTHLYSPQPWLEKVFSKHLAHADVLLHCGDITTFSVWQIFCQHPNFTAVLGNCDEWRLSDELRPAESLKIDGLQVGMVHGWGSRSGVPARAAEHFGPDYDLVCYGHTHIRNWDVINGVRMINPGSLSSPRDNNPPGFAYVTVRADKTLKCEFVDI